MHVKPRLKQRTSQTEHVKLCRALLRCKKKLPCFRRVLLCFTTNMSARSANTHCSCPYVGSEVLEFDSAANRLSIGSDALLLASDCKLAGGKPGEEALDLPIARRAGAASARESISGRTFGSCTSAVEIACVLATKRARRICNDTFQARLHGRRWFFNYAAVQHEQDAENCESERGVNVLFHTFSSFLSSYLLSLSSMRTGIKNVSPSCGQMRKRRPELKNSQK